MQNNEGAEAPTNKMQVKDKEIFINEFNASGKIWEILPKQFDCENITDNCLSCCDGQTNITLCSECEFVLVILDSGEPIKFTPFEVLTKILDTDPMIWLINEGWITSTTAEEQLFTQQIGKVSFFRKPVKNTFPLKEITVREAYEYIRGEALKEVTVELRKIKEVDDKKYRFEKERRLPYITFGGTFKKRADNQLKVKSWLMCFDIDRIDDIVKTRNTLINDPNLGVVLIFVSSSFKGLKAVIRSPEKANYREAYQDVMDYLKRQHDIPTDSTQDISRACLLCHDPDAYYNEDAPPTRLPLTTLPISLEPLPRSETNNGAIRTSVTSDIEKVEAYISALEEQAVDITVNYNEWVKLGFSFAILGEAGRSLFHRLSKMHPDYDFAEADKKFSNFLHSATGRVTLGTFFYYCHKHGVKPDNVMPSSYMTGPLPSAKTGPSLSHNKVSAAVNGVNKNPKTDQAPEEIDWNEVLRRLQIKPTDEIPIPPVAWKKGKVICGTLGEFSLFIGKAKSRKSFFVGLVVAGILNPDDPDNPFSGDLPKEKKKVIYFDTEQSKYHVHRALKRIYTMLGVKGTSAELIVYGLRPLSPHERMAAIEHAITTTKGLGVVIIDGIADLQTDINNPDQATMVASKLLNWTDVFHIHIITVLHENKGDRNARGHLGTEMVNKAETTLSITKDTKNPDVSIVEPEYCRSIAPDTFAFEINEKGLPVESLEYAMRKGKTVKAENLADAAIAEIFKKVFAIHDNISYASIWQGVKLAYHKLYNGNLPDNQAKVVVERAKFEGVICQERPRGPYSLCKG